MLDRIDFLVQQRAILESIFEEGWFANARERDKRHPAYMRWELCQKLIEQGEVIKEDQFHDLARMALDTYYFVQLTGGDIAQLDVGLFDSIGDRTVRKHIRSSLKKPDTYEDLMVQLYVAAWHKFNHHKVTLVEIDEVSWPDLRVDLEIPNIPMLIECKHLRDNEDSPGNLGGKIGRIVQRGNNQIKAGKKIIPHKQSIGHDHCYGVLVLDISSVLSAGEAEIDGFPRTVLEISNFTQRALSGNKNSSVHTAIVVWDTNKREVVSFLEHRYVCSRRCLRIHHTNPVRIFPDDMRSHILRFFDKSIQSSMLNDYEFQLVLARDNAHRGSIQ